MKRVCCCSLLLLIVHLSLLSEPSMVFAFDPTQGFTNVPLTSSSFIYQKPYNVPLNERYSFKNGIHRFWVYANDKPFERGSNTQPRTEAQIKPDYTSGIWQFEGYAFVPHGTSGATIVQIHGAAQGNTTLLLRIYNGDMRYYDSEVIATDLYDKWFKVNLIHNVDEGRLMVYINDVKKFESHDQGPGDLYFKCGVYGAPSDKSRYMESRWRDIKIYKK
ncbi:putative concanavalin A-like lectin/glucanase domain superfamily, alginate lyase 2 [Helianthus annuus]|uniref:Concanavalin A-like lectin/glucanase domain superfamily, alginate lyase 2 n=1 Tax=Helianthus annuus TaxID=4232 RepID=A0A251UTN3_HELAN|nr:citrate-binding protein [Helianthus annuus]KAF5807671.1 putative concanavalin A-like lectin/glucanase domain superfamily, alginate lyase 2 [Helianthus annuus]KAJ0571766.1 putative concanavalin A-like lectin/glucanase domain superfamily, alginate lyase 2 [Helianthus annuus]KAJ0586141.1 putative concanavalin A-like lectin/glucanase domain superfamily, alginate lyase 2 [Helianthus annuus]KAJ0924414.1 putative concanavalin A-like lectin/glucanase domain superfamily, alginate lyase 2 [Helianthus 